MAVKAETGYVGLMDSQLLGRNHTGQANRGIELFNQLRTDSIAGKSPKDYLYFYHRRIFDLPTLAAVIAVNKHRPVSGSPVLIKNSLVGIAYKTAGGDKKGRLDFQSRKLLV
ncbi:hypothetical protein [Microbulbifer sp. GL-2]|uniref:hypothetical protein n=1 Tax=Microbulbifer sp. GL-2 TaxID=2591606 RepID=UPI001163DC25|nr:hypothetical protein [Microbulbifer sp. GL-2]BBM04097.1 hypothetical protein GL2_41710 [Microbulbifer sp. GL-2]